MPRSPRIPVKASEFRTNFQTRLNNNTNRIANVAYSSRKPLLKFNEDAREEIEKSMKKEEDYFSSRQKLMVTLSTNPAVDPAELSARLATHISEFENQHKQVVALLDGFDSTISNAPQKSGFFIVK